jgi:cytochrome b subunit of formate dehydrogenase
MLALLLLAHCLKFPGGKARANSQAPESMEVLSPVDRSLHGLAALGLVGALCSGPLLRMPGFFPSFAGSKSAAVSSAHALFAGLALLALALHLARVCMLWLEGKSPWGLVPRPSDVSALLRGVLWNLGLSGRPCYGRYSYRERLGYAALIGMSLPMAASGLVIAKPAWFLQTLGGGALVAVGSIHAALGFCCLLALLWHIFFAQFQPGALWVNPAAFNGKLSWDRLAQTRPDWADELLGRPQAGPEEEGEAKQAATVEALLEEGNLAAREGRFAEAVRLYEEALVLYPGYSQALYNLGVARLKTGDAAGCRDALNRYLAQDSFGPVATRARELLKQAEKAEEEGGRRDGEG